MTFYKNNILSTIRKHKQNHMKRCIKNCLLITIVMLATACGTVKRIPQVTPVSFNTTDVVNGIKNGIQITESVWDEYVKLFPSTRGEDTPAVGWIIYDIDGDGHPEHILPQYEAIEGSQKVRLISLAIKVEGGDWQKADDRTIKELNKFLGLDQ